MQKQLVIKEQKNKERKGKQKESSIEIKDNSWCEEGKTNFAWYRNGSAY